MKHPFRFLEIRNSPGTGNTEAVRARNYGRRGEKSTPKVPSRSLPEVLTRGYSRAAAADYGAILG